VRHRPVEWGKRPTVLPKIVAFFYKSLCLRQVTSVIEVNVLWNPRVSRHLAAMTEVIVTVAGALEQRIIHA
jgi:hypothetical protein